MEISNQEVKIVLFGEFFAFHLSVIKHAKLSTDNSSVYKCEKCKPEKCISLEDVGCWSFRSWEVCSSILKLKDHFSQLIQLGSF